MDAPLRDCTIVEQCAIVTFLWTDEVKHFETLHRMLSPYGSENKITQVKVYDRVERYKTARTSVTGEARSGRSSASPTKLAVVKEHVMIREGRRLVLSTVAAHLGFIYDFTR